MSKTTDRKSYDILIDGDVVVDHHIYCGHCEHPSLGGEGTRIICQRGGAGLTASLLFALCTKEPQLEVRAAKPSSLEETPPSPEEHHAYAAWTPFEPKKGDKSKNARVWRVSETFGFGPVEFTPEPVPTGAAASDKQSHDVLVIDEGGLGYRDRPGDWPAVLGENWDGELPRIVLKMSHPICRGALWTRLAQDPYLDRLIVIVAADDLRMSGASISMGRSWEQAVQELLGDLALHPDVSQTARARHVIVNFGHDGALWVDNSDRTRTRRRLYFDPGHLEGSWQEELEGSVLGAGACLAASVARALFESVKISDAEIGPDGLAPRELVLTGGADLGAGIARGLAARRKLLESGHGIADAKKPGGFPYDPVLEALSGPRSGNLRTVSVPDSAIPGRPGTDPNWSIVAGCPVEGSRPLFGRARRVARMGEAALSGIPFGRFGKLYTVDRIELSGFYGIRRLMTDYVAERNSDKPLSLGVFGPPGSGKSFGIKEIARGILGKKTPILTFNLSQFDDPSMLVGALHQVRDAALRGEVPVVFWDEFDCRSLQWLQFMLAPMNDGEFLEGQMTHPVGKCIFIFAGGTCDSLAEFCEREDGAETEAFVAAKGPDFVSRLKGYLNVLGPNPRMADGAVDSADIGFPIRRAIMLRVQAKCFGSDSLTIDPGVLNAMIKIEKFKHGARSMATIVNLTTGGGKRGLLRCNLPPREQLELHVNDYDEFMALVQEGTMFKLRAEDLAPHVHEFYLDLAKEEGWKPKYPEPYKELPPDIRQDNIAAARRIPDVLSLVGLLVVEPDGKPGADPELVKKIIEENIELLAEAEHDGWMEFKIADGWTCAEVRDDKKKMHTALKAYINLPPVDQEKDRNAVRHYPDIVKEALFTIRLEETAGASPASP